MELKSMSKVCQIEFSKKMHNEKASVYAEFEAKIKFY